MGAMCWSTSQVTSRSRAPLVSCAIVHCAYTVYKSTTVSFLLCAFVIARVFMLVCLLLLPSLKTRSVLNRYAYAHSALAHSSRALSARSIRHWCSVYRILDATRKSLRLSSRPQKRAHRRRMYSSRVRAPGKPFIRENVIFIIAEPRVSSQQSASIVFLSYASPARPALSSPAYAAVVPTGNYSQNPFIVRV